MKVMWDNHGKWEAKSINEIQRLDSNILELIFSLFYDFFMFCSSFQCFKNRKLIFVRGLYTVEDSGYFWLNF